MESVGITEPEPSSPAEAFCTSYRTALSSGMHSLGRETTRHSTVATRLSGPMPLNTTSGSQTPNPIFVLHFKKWHNRHII